MFIRQIGRWRRFAWILMIHCISH